MQTTTKSPDFNLLLEQNHIPLHHRPYYHRWLGLYFQFCSQHSLDPLEKSSLDPFLKDLPPRNLKDFQIAQAQHAVVVYRKGTNPGFPASEKSCQVEREQEYSSVSRPQQDKFSFVFCKSSVSVVPFPECLPDKLDQLEENGSTSPQSSSIPSTISSWNDVFAALKTQIRLRHYSQSTLDNYGYYISKFSRFLNGKNPSEAHAGEAQSFLALMATTWHSSASSQNLAFNALAFLFKFILRKPYENLEDTPRAKRKRLIPEVLSRGEIDLLIRHLSSPYDLIAKLAYGCGLWLREAMSLRCHNFDLDTGILPIRNPEYRIQNSECPGQRESELSTRSSQPSPPIPILNAEF